MYNFLLNKMQEIVIPHIFGDTEEWIFNQDQTNLDVANHAINENFMFLFKNQNSVLQQIIKINDDMSVMNYILSSMRDTFSSINKSISGYNQHFANTVLINDVLSNQLINVNQSIVDQKSRSDKMSLQISDLYSKLSKLSDYVPQFVRNLGNYLSYLISGSVGKLPDPNSDPNYTPILLEEGIF